MNFSKNTYRFFQLLKQSLFNADIDTSIFSDMTSEDWREVRAISERQGVSAVAFDALDKLKTKGIELSITIDDLMDWLGQTSYVESTYSQQLEDSARLAKLWKEKDIKTMVFKGLALSRYYPVPSHREFGDFDCYVMPSAVSKVSEFLVSSSSNDNEKQEITYDRANRIAREAGCNVDTGWYKHSQIHFKSIMAENHKYFTQCRKGRKERAINKELTLAIGDGTALDTLEGTCLLLPPLTFEGLFLVYHAMAHFLLEGLTLRHICDWACWMKANQNKILWSGFYNKCKQYGFDRFIDALNAISVEHLGLEITNKDIQIDNTFADKILKNTLYEDSKIYSKKGGGKWYCRYAVIVNAFKYSWKYREIAQYSTMEYIWSYVSGFIFRNEED